jgi:tRNA pseudouridine38-40 synthase
VLNKHLPTDLRTVAAVEVEREFHSRFGADYRHYRYTILLTDRDPFRARFAHPYTGKLNLALMKDAAKSLKGEHDFRGFTEELDPDVENTVRDLFEFEVEQHEDEIWIDVKGTAFLRGMMRRMSGFLLEVGRGHRPGSDGEILLSENRDRVQWPVVLPAKGLCLHAVTYKPIQTASSDLSRTTGAEAASN